MALRMNPMTGRPEFIEDTPVINETTGQQANTAGQTALASTVAQPTPLPQVAQEPFNVPVDDRGVDIKNLSDSNTTSGVFDFRDQADVTAQSRLADAFQQQQDLQAQILELSQPSQELEDALASLNQVREDRDRLLDFSEDRLVDIGTIRGEQAQTQREFARREQTAINRANLLLNRQAQQISATEKALAFNQQNLDTILKLSEMTSPEIIGQEIDPVTGDVIAFTQNADGTITSQIIGKISVPDPEKETVGIVTNKATGQQSLVSLKDGVMVVEPIEGTAGVAGPKPLTEQDRLRNELLRAQIAKTEAETEDIGIQEERDRAQGIVKSQTIFDAANELLNNQQYLDALSGVSSLTSFVPGSSGFDAEAKLNRILNTLTLDNLGLMTGVLTDKDIEILTGAATSLKKGLDRDVLVAELTSIRDAAGSKISQDISLPIQAESYGYTPDEQDEIDFIWLGDSSSSVDYSSYFQTQ